MTSKREQIVRLRTENPILRLTQIADTVGVRKSYAHKVLTQAELPTKSVLIAKKNLPKRVVCRACGEDVPPSARRIARIKHIHDECRYEYFNILVHCRFCRTPFRRHRSLFTSTWKHNTYIYCSVECSRKGQKNDSTYDLRLAKQIDAT